MDSVVGADVTLFNRFKSLVKTRGGNPCICSAQIMNRFCSSPDLRSLNPFPDAPSRHAHPDFR